jgi:phospholipid transport system substrate-binding protein
MRNILIGFLLVLTAIPALAGGDEPIDALRKGVEEGLRILEDPEFSGADQREVQQQKLRLIMEQLFDFYEFSRRVLASKWKDFTPVQREEFVDVFTKFLAKYYLGKLQEKYSNESLIYVGQELTTPTHALVNVEVVWKGQPIPIDLRMIKRKGLWKVYDIEFVGISAVKNYRAQFHTVLQTETPAQVIEMLKMRTEALEKTDQKG